MSSMNWMSGPIASRTARARATSSASEKAPDFSFTERKPLAT